MVPQSQFHPRGMCLVSGSCCFSFLHLFISALLIVVGYDRFDVIHAMKRNLSIVQLKILCSGSDLGKCCSIRERKQFPTFFPKFLL